MFFWMTLDEVLEIFWMHSGQVLFFLCVVNLKYCCDILDDTMMQNKKTSAPLKKNKGYHSQRTIGSMYGTFTSHLPYKINHSCRQKNAIDTWIFWGNKKHRPKSLDLDFRFEKNATLKNHGMS